MWSPRVLRTQARKSPRWPRQPAHRKQQCNRRGLASIRGAHGYLGPRRTARCTASASQPPRPPPGPCGTPCNGTDTITGPFHRR